MQKTGFLTAFWAAFWALAKPYWVSRERRKGLTLLALLVGLSVGLVWIEVQWNLGDLGLTITDLALAAKSEIDKIREQSLNLE